MTKIYSIEAMVLGEIKNGFRLKISELGIGMYVSGFTARKSERNDSGWWIQPPATFQKKSGEWVRCPEFDTKTDFWKELEQEVVDAINLYASNEDKAIHLTQELEKPINLDDIPFDDDEPPKAVSWRNPDDL